MPDGITFPDKDGARVGRIEDCTLVDRVSIDIGTQHYGRVEQSAEITCQEIQVWGRWTRSRTGRV